MIMSELDLDLDDLEAKRKAGTEGVWDFDSSEMNPESTPNWTVYPEADPEHSVAEVNGQMNSDRDAALIVAAVNALHPLIDRVRVLETIEGEHESKQDEAAGLREDVAALERFRDLRTRHNEEMAARTSECVQLRADCDRLREMTMRQAEELIRCSCCGELQPEKTLVLCDDCDQTEALLQENEKLRARVADLEQRASLCSGPCGMGKAQS